MDQPPIIPSPEPAPAPTSPPAMSLAARLLNIFAVPGAVFEDVRTSRFSLGSVLVPVLLACVTTSVAFILVLTPPMLREIRESQRKTYAERVEAGKLSQDQANELGQMLDAALQPAVARTASTAAVTAFNVFRIFGWSFALWLLARRFLKIPVAFSKTMEIAGLATMISALGSVVGFLWTLRLDPAVSQDITTLIGDIQARSQSMLFVVLANLFSIWFVGILALGLARLTQARFAQAFFLVMGTWIAVQLLVALMGLALGTAA